MTVLSSALRVPKNVREWLPCGAEEGGKRLVAKINNLSFKSIYYKNNIDYSI